MQNGLSFALLLELDVGFLSLDGIAYGAHQHATVDLPFDPVVLCAITHGVDGHLFVVQIRYNHDWEGWRRLLHSDDGFHSPGIRQGQIEQDQIK